MGSDHHLGRRRPTPAEAARREAFVVLGAIPFAGPVLGPLAWAVIAWSLLGPRTPRDARFVGTSAPAAFALVAATPIFFWLLLVLLHASTH